MASNRRGDAAREAVKDKILSTFKDSFVQDKKIYLWENDGPGGELIQFAITMTMPKAPVGRTGISETKEDKVELTEEDQKTVEELMKRLGI